MTSFGIINCINSAEESRLRDTLRREGAHVMTLNGEEVYDAETFLKQATQDLPHPEGLEPHNWSAFVDCLWSALDEMEIERAAIIWTQADRMLHGGLSDLLITVSCFEEIARSVGSERASSVKIFQVFLLGEGTNFPTLEG